MKKKIEHYQYCYLISSKKTNDLEISFIWFLSLYLISGKFFEALEMSKMFGCCCFIAFEDNYFKPSLGCSSSGWGSDFIFSEHCML